MYCFVGAAPRVYRHDAVGNGEQAARCDPVLYRAQVGEPEVRRADHLIAIDLADQARLLNLRYLVAGQRDVLLQAERRLCIGEEIIDTVSESDAHEGQAIERCRADIVDPGRGIEADLHRDGVIALHLLGRESSGLRRDFEDHRRGIGIGLDIELGEGDNPGGDENQQAQQDDRTTCEAECEDGLQHDSPLARMRWRSVFIEPPQSSPYC